eukprot:9475952-Pyramimonas_sp.AAC.1
MPEVQASGAVGYPERGPSTLPRPPHQRCRWQAAGKVHSRREDAAQDPAEHGSAPHAGGPGRPGRRADQVLGPAGRGPPSYGPGKGHRGTEEELYDMGEEGMGGEGRPTPPTRQGAATPQIQVMHGAGGRRGGP